MLPMVKIHYYIYVDLENLCLGCNSLETKQHRAEHTICLRDTFNEMPKTRYDKDCITRAFFDLCALCFNAIKITSQGIFDYVNIELLKITLGRTCFV